MLVGVSNPEDNPADGDARREAADWHARLQSRAVSNAELRRFYAWHGAPANARAFAEIDDMWRGAGALGGDPDIAAAVRDAKAGGRQSWRQRLPVWRGWPVRVALPAAVAALVLLVASLFLTGRPTVYTSGVGERLAVRLEDGSRVTLDTATSIAVSYKAGERDIALTAGQALFEVAHDPARPFSVSAQGMKVTALGTVFTVRSGTGSARVTLIKGRISVEAPNKAVERVERAGETLIAKPGGLAPLGVDRLGATGWLAGKIDLREATLAEAIAELNRYTKRRIVLDDAALGETRVSGVFATNDPDAFAAAVTTLLPLARTTDAAGDIHLKGRP